MKKLLQKVSEWLIAALQRVKVKSCIAAVNSDDIAGERRLRDNNNRATLDIENSDSESSSSFSSSSKEEANPLLVRIEEFIHEHYQVRVNVLSGQYEVTARGAQQWMVLNGTLCNRILMELNHAGIILAKPYIVITVIEGGAMVEQYHPVRSYLESLPTWDGMGRIERSTFGHYLTEFGAQQVRVRSKRVYGVACAVPGQK